MWAVGCVSASEFDLDGSWTLASIGPSKLPSVAGKERPTFTINGLDIEGFDGCNSFSGPLDEAGAIATTRQACPEDVVLLPLDLNDLGGHLMSGRIEGDVLTVPARGAYPASTYLRQTKAESSSPGADGPDLIEEVK